MNSIIPKVGVKTSGKGITYDDTNKSLVKNRDPIDLQGCLNGILCKKRG